MPQHSFLLAQHLYLEVMPYQWTDQTLTVWPHRSLPARGFVWFIGATAVLFTLPLLAQLGSPALWVLLPFLTAAVAAVWYALQRNNRDRAIVETLTLSPTELSLTRTGPKAQVQHWLTNPYWVHLTLHKTAGPVPNYLTLRANGREVELGAFLTEPERIALKADLESQLHKVKQIAYFEQSE